MNKQEAREARKALISRLMGALTNEDVRAIFQDPKFDPVQIIDTTKMTRSSEGAVSAYVAFMEAARLRLQQIQDAKQQ